MARTDSVQRAVHVYQYAEGSDRREKEAPHLSLSSGGSEARARAAGPLERRQCLSGARAVLSHQTARARSWRPLRPGRFASPRSWLRALQLSRRQTPVSGRRPEAATPHGARRCARRCHDAAILSWCPLPLPLLLLLLAVSWACIPFRLWPAILQGQPVGVQYLGLLSPSSAIEVASKASLINLQSRRVLERAKPETDCSLPLLLIHRKVTLLSLQAPGQLRERHRRNSCKAAQYRKRPYCIRSASETYGIAFLRRGSWARCATGSRVPGVAEQQRTHRPA